MKKTVAAEALDLAEDILTDLELSRLPLHGAYMKGVRLARLLGDAEQLSIFQYELSGYPASPKGITPDIWRLCERAGRVSQSIDKKTGKEKSSAYTTSVEQLESYLDITKMRLEFGRPQPVSISSANPGQYVTAPGRHVPLERSLSEALTEATGKLSARRQFLYSYCLDRAMELKVSSAAERIFEDYRTNIDKSLTRLLPAELVRIKSIEENLSSEISEDWANALHSCRRLLQAIADSLYPPIANQTVKSGSGKNVKIGPENYINRLILYCESKSDSVVFEKVVGSSLEFLGDRLDAIFSAVQKGSHADVSLKEARRYVISTYIIIGDILTLAEVDAATLVASVHADPVGVDQAQSDMYDDEQEADASSK